MDYFEFYDIPINLQIDQANLRKIYLVNSKKYHPDFYTLSESDAQERALEFSGLNNKAYEVLKDEYSRIKYILNLQNMLQEGQDKLSPDFLMEMMEINETMEELQIEPSVEQKKVFLTDIQARINSLKKSIEHLFLLPSLSLSDLELLKIYYLKQRYFQRLTENFGSF